MNLEDFNNLSDEELCKRLCDEYEAKLQKEADKDYVVNPPQWKKLFEVLAYFYNLAQKNHGNVELDQITPKYKHGGVTAYFLVMDLQANDIPRFCTALLKTNAVTIDTMADGRLCISVSVPNVFVKKT